MAVHVFNVGDVLAANDVNQWLTPLAAVKPNDTGRSTLSITNDPDLQLTLAASASYYVEAFIQYKGPTNGSADIQFQVNAPGSASGFWGITRLQITSFPLTTIVTTGFGLAVNAGCNGTSNLLPAFIRASVTTAAGGTLAIAWSQNSGPSGTSTVLAGSTLVAQRIG